VMTSVIERGASPKLASGSASNWKRKAGIMAALRGLLYEPLSKD
jgi:hypothetical protein